MNLQKPHVLLKGSIFTHVEIETFRNENVNITK